MAPFFFFFKVFHPCGDILTGNDPATNIFCKQKGHDYGSRHSAGRSGPLRPCTTKCCGKLTPTKQSERECSIQAAHTSQGRRHLRSGPYSQTVAYSAGDLVPNENVFAVLYLSACLEHWAMLHSEDVAVLKSSVPRILVSKTQDMQKKLQLQSATPSAAPSSALSPSATPNLRMEAESVKDK